MTDPKKPASLVDTLFAHLSALLEAPNKTPFVVGFRYAIVAAVDVERERLEVDGPISDERIDAIVDRSYRLARTKDRVAGGFEHLAGWNAGLALARAHGARF